MGFNAQFDGEPRNVWVARAGDEIDDDDPDAIAAMQRLGLQAMQDPNGVVQAMAARGNNGQYVFPANIQAGIIRDLVGRAQELQLRDEPFAQFVRWERAVLNQIIANADQAGRNPDIELRLTINAYNNLVPEDAQVDPALLDFIRRRFHYYEGDRARRRAAMGQQGQANPVVQIPDNRPLPLPINVDMLVANNINPRDFAEVIARGGVEGPFRPAEINVFNVIAALRAAGHNDQAVRDHYANLVDFYYRNELNINPIGYPIRDWQLRRLNAYLLQANQPQANPIALGQQPAAANQDNGEFPPQREEFFRLIQNVIRIDDQGELEVAPFYAVESVIYDQIIAEAARGRIHPDLEMGLILEDYNQVVAPRFRIDNQVEGLVRARFRRYVAQQAQNQNVQAAVAQEPQRAARPNQERLEQWPDYVNRENFRELVNLYQNVQNPEEDGSPITAFERNIYDAILAGANAAGRLPALDMGRLIIMNDQANLGRGNLLAQRHVSARFRRYIRELNQPAAQPAAVPVQLPVPDQVISRLH